MDPYDWFCGPGSHISLSQTACLLNLLVLSRTGLQWFSSHQCAGAPGIPLPGAGTSTAFLSSVRPTHCSTSRASRSTSSSDFSGNHRPLHYSSSCIRSAPPTHASNANLTYWRSSWSAPPDTPCAWWEHQTSAPGRSSDPPPAETHTHLRFAALSGPLRLVWDRKYGKNLKWVEKSLKIPSEVHPPDQSTSSASISHRVYNKHQRHDAKSKHYFLIYVLCLIIKNLRYILNIIRRLKNMDQYKLLVYLILISL